MALCGDFIPMQISPFSAVDAKRQGGSETSVDDSKDVQLHCWLLMYQHLHFRQFQMKAKITPETFGTTRSLFPAPPVNDPKSQNSLCEGVIMVSRQVMKGASTNSVSRFFSIRN